MDNGDDGPARRMGRGLAIAAAACYGTALLLPFVQGSVRLLVVPIARNVTLTELLRRLAHDGSYLPLASVALLGFAAPIALLLAVLPAALRGTSALPRPLAAFLAWWRVRGLVAAVAGTALTAGIRASSGVGGQPTLRILPGAWAYIASLVLAAAAANLLSPRRAPRPEAPASAP